MNLQIGKILYAINDHPEIFAMWKCVESRKVNWIRVHSCVSYPQQTINNLFLNNSDFR